ncbi:MAG: hypothetical protein IKH57_01045 [Clostridia bacterium]|nr:hypothetical protein [Clostridia bacterium]
MTIKKMKKWIAAVVLVLMAYGTPCSAESVDTLTYAVFPYLPDAVYYQELIEKRWAEIEPGIKLIRADWDCYEDGAPDGIDVIMYDAVKRDALIEAGWIQPIGLSAVQNADDIFPFAIEGLTVEGQLYGIPVFLCGNFLIYDVGCDALVHGEHLTDLARESEILVINSDFPENREQYAFEILADTLREANPKADSGAEEMLSLMDRLAIDAHQRDDDTQVALAYDSGIGQGYIGFSESIRLLNLRVSQTGIKAISFSDQKDLPRVYTDAAAVTGGVDGLRYEKCIELMNVMAEADILTALSVQDGVPQYLLLARKSPYKPLAGQFQLYAQLEKLAFNKDNRVILGP